MSYVLGEGERPQLTRALPPLRVQETEFWIRFHLLIGKLLSGNMAILLELFSAGY